MNFTETIDCRREVNRVYQQTHDTRDYMSCQRRLELAKEKGTSLSYYVMATINVAHMPDWNDSVTSYLAFSPASPFSVY